MDSVAGIAGEVLSDGFSVRDEFLNRNRVEELCRCAEVRRERGEFCGARMGAIAQSIRAPAIRGDSTCWLNEPLFAAEQALLGDLELLRLDLNREGYLGLFDLELHYAAFPAGRGYDRHVDQLRGRGQRRISVIVYLNIDWPAGNGGELRFFDAQGDRDIAPLGGRLVCFASEGREHAVLTTQCERLSLSGWFRTRP